jgi:hypothetical protein
MREELYNVLLDSSQVDFKNGEILMQTEMYYYSIVFFVKSVKNLLGVLYIHTRNEVINEDEDINNIIKKIDMIPDEIESDINYIIENCDELNENLGKDKLKTSCALIHEKTKNICSTLKLILMGESVSLN